MKKNLTLEQALGRLDEIVAALNDGDAPLDTALGLFAEGAELIAYCNTALGEAKLVIEKLLPEGENRDEVV